MALLSTLDIIMLVANIVFIIIAVFLFIRLRKIEKKPEPEINQQTELSGITDITPVEFNRERFGIEDKEIPKPEKTSEAGEEEKIEASTIAELKLEDELPEVEEKEAPMKKRAAKKPEKIEFKFEEKEPEKEEEKTEKKPEKKESKKKKPVKKEPAAKKETKPAPGKKAGKKKKESSR
jgi:type IV secretory pathway VirB10-like protein